MTAHLPKVPPSFGRRLRAERAARGWSLRQAAVKAGVSQQTAWRAESGCDIAFSTAIRLAAVYGLGLDVMLGGPEGGPG